jgi:predicted transcriptional regulator of viral defense system
MEKLVNRSFFTTKEAEELGVSRRMLSYYVKSGLFERIGKGAYRGTNLSHIQDEKWLELATVAKRTNGVICLLSALIYYELSDDFMDEYWVAIPHEQSKLDIPDTRIIRTRNFASGIDEVEIAGMKVRIYDRERTIIDCFRLLDIETAMKALKMYMSGKNKKSDIKKLNRYAKELRHDISKYLLPFII